jgi:hypothetical protein
MIQLVNLIQRYWLPVTAALTLGVASASLWPVHALPPVPGSDKTHHFIAYALLILPVAIARPKRWVIASLFFLTFSGIIELIQPSVNRYGEWLDLLANGGGIVCGLIIANLVRILTTGLSTTKREC